MRTKLFTSVVDDANLLSFCSGGGFWTGKVYF